jgi:hypothetical protein
MFDGFDRKTLLSSSAETFQRKVLVVLTQLFAIIILSNLFSTSLTLHSANNRFI